MVSLPIGNDDFKSVRNNGGYYIDKTELISGILSNPSGNVHLFTRPRRFGKTLNMSMLDAFFNVKYKGNTWFDGLKISDIGDYVSEKNRYPVISISMKNIYSEDYGEFLTNIRNKIMLTCVEYEYILKSDISPNLKIVFERLYFGNATESDLRSCLLILSVILKQFHKENVVILIDEYDNPIQNTYGLPVQKKIIDFMRDFMSSALKTNDRLKFGIVTGVMQIAKESIFSGLNNLNVNNILSDRFDESFGFTEREVKQLLSDSGHAEKIDEVRAWYDGYRFGNAEMYNPWSVMNYIAEGFRPNRYWAGTSGNDIIRMLLNVPDDDIWEDLQKLGMKEPLTKELDSTVTYSQIENDPRTIYSIMVMSGYLNAVETVDREYILSIPNKEMFEVYSDMIYSTIGSNNMAGTIRRLFNKMQLGDTEAVENSIHDLMKETISSKILDNEHVYQAYLIGMMMGFCGNYTIYGDRLESGDGFADIIFKKNAGLGVNVIVELKKSKDEKDLEKDANLAMEQIFEKDYMHDMSGRTLLYGISFHSKKPHIISREISG